MEVLICARLRALFTQTYNLIKTQQLRWSCTISVYQCASGLSHLSKIIIFAHRIALKEKLVPTKKFNGFSIMLGKDWEVICSDIMLIARSCSWLKLLHLG